ncbi:hypothetical protein, conserved [Babesia bigemina]|uniref:Rad60/SUMO-like domain-containing protein n=1 Tax=Babesia bigemina TaxID=5866 RepID=A0A061D269_BABBI|nr:hypothetical protein, conserved [Babesia bigemina]CDR94207.1 hypothetical protein, conserved [Babesia bigemina]|eukprot:XP_012766393.1 hypothetical protein, conserved [Babesia bigemina]
MRLKGSTTYSDGDSREIEDIFSEDVKDPSMYMIISSDEDEEEHMYESTCTPIKSTSVERRTNRDHDFLSAKVCRQYRLREELYQRDLKADAILSQINQFFEQSMASLVSAGAKTPDDVNTPKDHCEQTQENVRPTESKDAKTGDSIVVQDNCNLAVEIYRDIRKRKRKQNTKYYFNEDPVLGDTITDEVGTPSAVYIPCNRTKGHKRSSAQRTRSKFVNDDQIFDVTGQSNILTPKTLNDELEGKLNKRERSNNKTFKGTQEISVTVSHTDLSVQSSFDTVLQTTPRRSVKQHRRGKNNKSVTQQMGESSTDVRNICLKFVIIDENCSVIKDERLEKVIVRHDETIGNLAAKFGKLFDLDENKHRDIKIYVDGDLQPHDIAIGSEMLEIEDGMQVDIKFPQKNAGEGLVAVSKSTQETADDALSNVVGHVASNACATEPHDWVSRALFEDVIEID